jgi:hypothetical protein
MQLKKKKVEVIMKKLNWYERPQGKGYIGKSMSVNAKEAYERHEMPLSKWTKNKILEAIDDLSVDVNLELLKRLTKEQLQDVALCYCGYHHTGKYYNETDFYAVDEELVKGLTDDKINELVLERKNELEKTKAERAKQRQQQELRRYERERKEGYKQEVQGLLQYSGYKTLNGLLKAIESKKIDIDDLKKKKQEAEDELKKKVFLSLAGQVIKGTNYTDVTEMYDDYIEGKLNQDILDKINNKTFRYKF